MDKLFLDGIYNQTTLDNILKKLGSPKKAPFTQNIVRSNLKVLAVKSQDIKDIVKSISTDAYICLLDNMTFDYYEDTLVYAGVMSKLKDFETLKKYLDNYVAAVDCWASVDTMKFSLKSPSDKEKLLSLAVHYTRSSKPYVRRSGYRIMFDYISSSIDTIFDCIKDSYTEQEYYVNMIIAWLLCECFIKNRDETLAFIESTNLNNFVLRKFVSKCHDSYRVTAEDKELLTALKNSKLK